MFWGALNWLLLVVAGCPLIVLMYADLQAQSTLEQTQLQATQKGNEEYLKLQVLHKNYRQMSEGKMATLKGNLAKAEAEVLLLDKALVAKARKGAGVATAKPTNRA